MLKETDKSLTPIFWILAAIPIIQLIADISLGTESTYAIRGAGMLHAVWMVSCLFLAMRQGFSFSDAMKNANWFDLSGLGIPVLVTILALFFAIGDFGLPAHRTYMTLLYVAAGLGLYFLVCNASNRAKERLLTACVIGITLYAVGLAVLLMTGILPEDADWFEIVTVPGMTNPRFIGYWAAPAIALALVAWSVRERRFSGIALLVSGSILSLLWALVFWSGSRAAVLAICVGIVVSLLISRKYVIATLAMLAITATLGAGLSTLHQPNNPSFGIERIFSIKPKGSDKSLNRVSSNRLELWQQTFEKSLERPFIGHGIGQLREHVQVGQAHQAHNFFLNKVFDIGYPATALLTVWLAVNWLLIAGDVWRGCDNATLASFTGFNVLLPYALFDGVFVHYNPMILIAIFLSIGIASVRQGSRGMDFQTRHNAPLGLRPAPPRT